MSILNKKFTFKQLFSEKAVFENGGEVKEGDTLYFHIGDKLVKGKFKREQVEKSSVGSYDFIWYIIEHNGKEHKVASYNAYTEDQLNPKGKVAIFYLEETGDLESGLELTQDYIDTYDSIQEARKDLSKIKGKRNRYDLPMGYVPRVAK